MYDFETLVEELLRKRPELGREELMRRVAAKKEIVGAGYLTNQGALFLVAGELGVALQQVTAPSYMRLKDLYVGANDVTVMARILAIYPISTYRSKDGGEGRYRRLVLFDGNRSMRLTVWDDKVDDVEKLGMVSDTPVRVVSGYVKQGLDGKSNLNLGKRGSIAIVSDMEVAELPKLSAATEKLVKLEQERTFVAVEAIVDSEPRYSEFVRSDGSQGSLFQFGVSGEHGKARVVIWSPASRPELRLGQKVVIANVKSKRSSNGEFEIHGDAGSVIFPGSRREPLQMRVAAILPGPSKTILLALDRTKKVWVVEVGDETEAAATGNLVEVSADEESGGRLICKTPDAFTVVDKDSSPRLVEFITKLKDAKGEAPRIMVEVISLSRGTTDDVRQNDGSVIKRGELMVGDDTAEMKVVGWREQSEKLQGIQPGERLRISGVRPRVMKMGGTLLEVDALTVLEKVGDSTRPSSA
jgi:replication factor A1